MLKSEVEAGYLRRSTVSRDYVRKSDVACAGVVVEGDARRSPRDSATASGGVDEEKETLSPRETAKLYRKAGKFQKKLRSAWPLLGVRPYLVQVTRSATAASPPPPRVPPATTVSSSTAACHPQPPLRLHLTSPGPTACSRARRRVCCVGLWRRTGC